MVQVGLSGRQMYQKGPKMLQNYATPWIAQGPHLAAPAWRQSYPPDWSTPVPVALWQRFDLARISIWGQKGRCICARPLGSCCRSRSGPCGHSPAASLGQLTSVAAAVAAMVSTPKRFTTPRTIIRADPINATQSTGLLVLSNASESSPKYM